MIRLNKKGFTIPEVLMSFIVMVFVFVGIIGFYASLQQLWAGSNIQTSIDRQARGVMERMVRGVTGTDGLREAKSAIMVGTSTIKYVSGIDNKERSFYLNGDKVMYDPDTASTGDEISIADKIRASPSGLTFTISGKLITISLSFQDTLQGKAMNTYLSARVWIRN